MALRSEIAYRLLNLAGRVMPEADRTRLLRVLATGDPEDPAERASLAEIINRDWMVGDGGNR